MANMSPKKTSGTTKRDPETGAVLLDLQVGSDGLRMHLPSKVAAAAVRQATPEAANRTALENTIVDNAAPGTSSYSEGLYGAHKFDNSLSFAQIRDAALSSCGLGQGAEMTGTRSDRGAGSVFVAVCRMAGYDRESIRKFLGRGSPSTVTNAERRAALLKDKVQACIQKLTGNHPCRGADGRTQTTGDTTMAITTKKAVTKVTAKKTVKVTKAVKKVAVKAAPKAAKKAVKAVVAA